MPGFSFFDVIPGQLIMEIEHYYFYVGPSHLFCLKYRCQQRAKAFIIKDFILGTSDIRVPSYESCCCRFFSSGAVVGAEVREQSMSWSVRCEAVASLSMFEVRVWRREV